MAIQLEDFSLLLRGAIAEARSAGLVNPADALEARASVAYTTSSEFLGEVGQAIVTFLSEGDAAVPPAAVDKLDRCLLQVQRVWPEIRVRRR